MSRKTSRQASIKDDAISLCGDAFVFDRRRTVCSLQSHSPQADSMAIKPNPHETIKRTLKLTPAQIHDHANFKQHKRFNGSFHHLRYVIAVMGGTGVGLMMCMRLSVSVALLNMVNQTHLFLEEHPNKTVDDFLAEGYVVTDGEFNWNNEIQQMIMSWYMITYTLLQVPMTKVAQLTGPRLSMSVSLAACAISLLLTPELANWGWRWVVGLRLLNGLGASAIITIVMNLIETWAPINELSFCLTLSQTTQASLIAITPMFAGFLSSISWKCAYYVPGALGLLYALLWLIIMSDTPEKNRWVSQRELEVICQCHKLPIVCPADVSANGDKVSCEIQDQQAPSGDANHDESQYQGTIFDAMRNRTFYMLGMLWLVHVNPHTIFLFTLPVYLQQFLKISIEENGFYCFVIQTGYILGNVWPHYFMQFIKGHFGFSETAARRSAIAIVCIGAALTWILVALFNTFQLPLLLLNRAFHSGGDIILLGTLMGCYTKAGISGMVFSMVNSVANLSSVPICMLIGYMLDYTGQSIACWRCINLGTAGAMLTIMTIYCSFARYQPVVLQRKPKTAKQVVSA